MKYELRIRNPYNYGHTTIYGDSIQEIKNKLNDLLVDDCATIKLYETKELPMIDYEKYDFRKHVLDNISSKYLYDNACVYKDWVKVREEGQK